VQVAETIFTERTSREGAAELVDGRAAAGSAGAADGRSALSLSAIVPVTSTVWPTCSLSLVEPLGMTFRLVAEAMAAGGVPVPEVPTAPVPFVSLFHFRSYSMKLSAESPAFRQPVTVMFLEALVSRDSCIGG
jgi:hypothetical protein